MTNSPSSESPLVLPLPLLLEVQPESAPSQNAMTPRMQTAAQTFLLNP